MKRCSVLFLMLLASCANIIDLEERKVGDAGIGGSSGALNCATYCQEARSLCTPDKGSELFNTDDSCSGTCAAYPPGDPANPVGNTLACRLNQLAKVKSIGEASSYCPGAGAGGGSADVSAACGSDCEGYCALYASVCGTPIPDCLNKCPALPNPGMFNLSADYGSGKDTLNCRLAHLTAAAAAKFTNNLGDTMAHCSHSGLKSSVQCDVKDPMPIKCDDFCKIANAACTGANQVYSTDLECQKVCAQLTPGMTTDLLTNSVRCRRENAYAALTGTTANLGLTCSNAGPIPALCGSGKCESYCQLSRVACPDRFKVKYQDDMTKCQTDCGALSDQGQNFVYSTGTALTPNGTLHCRALRVARALGGDGRPETCQAALGEAGSECH